MYQSIGTCQINDLSYKFSVISASRIRSHKNHNLFFTETSMAMDYRKAIMEEILTAFVLIFSVAP
jgi:hypothetical protein